MKNLSNSALPLASLTILITLPIITYLIPNPIATGICEAALLIIGEVYGKIKSGESINDTPENSAIAKLANNFLNHLSLFAAILLVNALVAFFTTSSDVAVLDMQKKGIITFPKDLNGFEHLHIYVSGFIGTALLTLVLPWHGIILGRGKTEITYSSLFFSLLCAVFFSKILINISGNSGYDVLQKTKPPFPIPDGTIPLQIVFRTAMYIAQAAFFAAVVWVLALLSRWITNIFNPKS